MVRCFHVFTHLLLCGFNLWVHVGLRYVYVRQALEQMELE